MNSKQCFSYLLLLGDKVEEDGEQLIEHCKQKIVEINLDDVDDIGDINNVGPNSHGQTDLGFGNAEDGYYVINGIFDIDNSTVNYRTCCEQINVDDFLKVLERKTREHCPEAFND